VGGWNENNGTSSAQFFSSLSSFWSLRSSSRMPKPQKEANDEPQPMVDSPASRGAHPTFNHAQV
jgi:hypothetical protein